LKIHARLLFHSTEDASRIFVSKVNGLVWQEVWHNEQIGETPAELQLIDEVSGAYEVLVKVSLQGKRNTARAQLQSIDFETITMLNSKTQPHLKLGKNTIFVGAEEQTESIV